MPETLYKISAGKAAPGGENSRFKKGTAWTEGRKSRQQVVRIYNLAANRRFASMEITLKFDPSKTAKRESGGLFSPPHLYCFDNMVGGGGFEPTI